MTQPRIILCYVWKQYSNAHSDVLIVLQVCYLHSTVPTNWYSHVNKYREETQEAHSDSRQQTKGRLTHCILYIIIITSLSLYFIVGYQLKNVEIARFLDRCNYFAFNHQGDLAAIFIVVDNAHNQTWSVRTYS